MRKTHLVPDDDKQVAINSFKKHKVTPKDQNKQEKVKDENYSEEKTQQSAINEISGGIKKHRRSFLLPPSIEEETKEHDNDMITTQ